jgi:non-specific serine/threonine protein kinase
MSHRRPIVQLSPEPVPFPRIEPSSERLAHLPLPLTSFVGRASEIAVVGALLDRPDVRLVTLTGAGGVGKTRLAMRVAEEWVSEFTDGVVFVSLAELHDSDHLANLVAERLGVFERTTRDPEDAVQSYLADRAFLLILDNFEHLLPAAPVLARWLAHCRWLTILVTSRFQLGLSGEHEIVVRPLPVPATELSFDRIQTVPSVELFLARARAARADFALCTANAHAVATICARLEGLPLAIELAAARMSHMGPEDLIERMERGLPVLLNGPRDQPDRMRSLDDAISWSFDLLSHDEQMLLQSLSVLAGGFDLQAAGAVAAEGTDVLEGVASLVGKSFLAPQDTGGLSRYTMLESIRAYANVRLEASGNAEDVRQRHARYFVELAEQEDEGIWGGPRHRQALDRLEVDLPNCRVALSWLETTGDHAGVVRLAAALGGIWHYRSHWQEGRAWLEKGLSQGGMSAPAARATALVKLTILTRDLGETPDPAWAAEAVQIRRARRDDRALGRALILSASLVPPDEVDRKLALLAEAEIYSRRADNATGVAWIYYGRGVVRRGAGDLETAQHLIAESLTWFRKDQFFFGAWIALIELAELDLERGRYRGAAVYFHEMLGFWDATLSKELLVAAVSRIAGLFCARGRPDAAVTLLSALDALGQTARLAAAPRDLERSARTLADAREQLDESSFVAAWARGERATIASLIDDSRTLLLSLAEPRPAAPVPNDTGLSSREIDVIRLLAEGLSNREIAQELCIGESTVISHVRNIMIKLDLKSRTAAAAWAFRHGLCQIA